MRSLLTNICNLVTKDALVIVLMCRVWVLFLGWELLQIVYQDALGIILITKRFLMVCKLNVLCFVVLQVLCPVLFELFVLDR